MKTFVFILGFIGVMMILGSVGAHEQNNIGTLQFIVQELIAIACVFVAYVINEVFVKQS